MPRNHLVIFAKSPRLGRVKTRLARDIGTVPAWHFYRSMIHRLPRHLARGDWITWLAISPDRDAVPRPWWPGRGVRFLKQGGGTLGERMIRPARTLPPGNFIIVGTDIPALGPEHVREAFRLLGRHDAVFGPGDDGGYYLVGLKRHAILPRPFDHVRWSTEFALPDTLGNLIGRRVAFLETLTDVDDGAAYARCSFKRGISSTKLHGLVRASS